MAENTLARSAIMTRLARSREHFLNWYHARRSRRAKTVTAFVSQPEPRTIGSYARGRQLMAGNFLFAGHLVEAAETSIWDIRAPDAAFEAQLQGFGWLDDLVAVGDIASRDLAQAWLVEWIDRYGDGAGAGWMPDLAGRRAIRWINHALFLLKGQDKEKTDAYFHALARQTYFLNKRWRAAPHGIARFEALTGLIYAGLALEGMADLIEPSMLAVANECETCVDPDGGIPSRNPEQLLEVFTLLTWAAAALSEEGHVARREHLLAIERIAPTLRALRHSDGSLARFHGGGRGLAGRLDQALAASGVRATASTGLAMGYVRLSGGRTSVVLDACKPPMVKPSANAHASTLAFELTSGRRPIIVNCGSGAQFGPQWRRAGRATPSHSTLGIEGYSSSRFGARRLMNNGPVDLLVDGPDEVRVQQSNGLDGATVLATHNGYAATHGLQHVRRLDLSLDGRELIGEDTLGALSETERIRFEQLVNDNNSKGVAFAARFHVHPDVEAELDLNGTAVSLSLKSGEVWVFRNEGEAKMALEPSVYLERGRLKPRATKQIVLSDVVMDYAAQVSWTLSKAQDGKAHVRDVDEEAMLAQF